jgi:CBS domain-containing protein
VAASTLCGLLTAYLMNRERLRVHDESDLISAQLIGWFWLGFLSTFAVAITAMLEKLHAVKPATTLTDALETMGREDVNQLPVMSNGHLDGIISRSHILRLLQTRAELQV